MVRAFYCKRKRKRIEASQPLGSEDRTDDSNPVVQPSGDALRGEATPDARVHSVGLVRRRSIYESGQSLEPSAAACLDLSDSDFTYATAQGGVIPTGAP